MVGSLAFIQGNVLVAGTFQNGFQIEILLKAGCHLPGSFTREQDQPGAKAPCISKR